MKATNNCVIAMFQILGGLLLFIIFGKASISSIIAPDYVNHSDGTYVIAFLVALGGLWFIILGIKRILLEKKLHVYLQVINLNSSTSIWEISKFSGDALDVVLTNLEAMIKRGFFYRASISSSGTHLIFRPEDDPEHEATCEVDYEANVEEEFDVPPAASFNKVIVKCRGCGAIATIPAEQIVECEYCGSPLSNTN